MAHLSDKQRLQRSVDFLTGLSHPEVRAALRERGLTEQETEEGFRLLREAIAAFHLGSALPESPPDVVALLDAWENRWLPVISAALTRHFPGVARSVLRNIKQTRGPALLINLHVLLDRLAALESSTLAPEQRALALLRQRGVSPAVLAEARAHIHGAQHDTSPSQPAPCRSRAATLAALWSWYLEWSQIARVTLTDARLLAALGFRKRSGGPK